MSLLDAKTCYLIENKRRRVAILSIGAGRKDMYINKLRNKLIIYRRTNELAQKGVPNAKIRVVFAINGTSSLPQFGTERGTQFGELGTALRLAFRAFWSRQSVPG